MKMLPRSALHSAIDASSGALLGPFPPGTIIDSIDVNAAGQVVVGSPTLLVFSLYLLANPPRPAATTDYTRGLPLQPEAIVLGGITTQEQVTVDPATGAVTAGLWGCVQANIPLGIEVGTDPVWIGFLADTGTSTISVASRGSIHARTRPASGVK